MAGVDLVFFCFFFRFFLCIALLSVFRVYLFMVAVHTVLPNFISVLRKVMEPLYDNSAIRLKRCQIQTYAANFLRPRFNKPINYSMSFQKSFIYFTILSISVSLLVCNTKIVCMFIWFLLPADSAWTNFL